MRCSWMRWWTYLMRWYCIFRASFVHLLCIFDASQRRCTKDASHNEFHWWQDAQYLMNRVCDSLINVVNHQKLIKPDLWTFGDHQRCIRFIKYVCDWCITSRPDRVNQIRSSFFMQTRPLNPRADDHLCIRDASGSSLMQRWLMLCVFASKMHSTAKAMDDELPSSKQKRCKGLIKSNDRPPLIISG